MKIQAFIESLDTPSTETRRAYTQDIERFAAFLSEKGLRVNQVKPSTVNEYVKYLRENQGRVVGDTLAPATIGRRLAVCSEYYKWLGDNSDTTVRNPFERVKRPKVQNELPRAVDDSVLSTLVHGITDIRDKAIILLLIHTGLRLAELCQLNKDSIVSYARKLSGRDKEYFGRGQVVGKGRKRRQFIAGPTAMKAVGEYIRKYRTVDNNPALFLSQRNRRISCRSVQDILNRWCIRLGVAHVHVHQLRHTFATRNVNGGMTAAVLQELMGHSSLSKTQRYFRVRPERLTREYFAAMEFVRLTSSV